MMIGPFDLKNIIIAAIIAIAVTVAMYLLKGVLSIGFTIPLWLLVIAIVTIAAVLFLLVSTLLGYWKNGREGFIFAQARQKGIPVIEDVEIGSENAEFVLGMKKSPKDVTFSDEESGVKLDPSLLSHYARPRRHPGGLDIFTYAFYNFMPQTTTNHAAFKAIEEYFKSDKCKDLRFLSIKEFVELVSDPEHFLEHNALIKLNKYFKIVPKLDESGKPIVIDNKPQYRHIRQFETVNSEGKTVWMEQDITLEGMIQLISRARNDIATLPIMGGYLAGTEAFKNNSVPYSSQHLGHAFMLFKKKDMEEWLNKFDKQMMVYIILAICGGIGVILAIIFTIGPGAVGK